jgi:hypothetical protein
MQWRSVTIARGGAKADTCQKYRREVPKYKDGLVYQ